MSPVFHRENGYVYKVYSNEEERMHIHVLKAEKEAKFWLEPTIELDENFGFDSKEIKHITQIIKDNKDDLKNKYAIHVYKRIND